MPHRREPPGRIISSDDFESMKRFNAFMDNLQIDIEDIGEAEGLANDIVHILSHLREKELNVAEVEAAARKLAGALRKLENDYGMIGMDSAVY